MGKGFKHKTSFKKLEKYLSKWRNSNLGEPHINDVLPGAQVESEVRHRGLGLIELRSVRFCSSLSI